MPTRPRIQVLIAGGGIGGLTAALALCDAGFDVSVYEQADALKPVGAGISLWPNATRVLKHLGVLPRIVEHGTIIRRAQLRTPSGSVLAETQAPGQFDVPAVCIQRTDLHQALLERLDQVAPGALHLGRRIERFTQDRHGVTIFSADGPLATGDVLIGCDGIRSAVRAQLVGDGEPVYRGYAVWRGLVRYDGAASPDHIGAETWGAGRRFGCFPTHHDVIYWFATLNEPPDQPDPEGAKARLLRLFEGWHAPIPDLIAATDEADILKHTIQDRPPLSSWSQGRVTLLGDAAHPMTPNLGQGACAAIEDGAVLARCLRDHPTIDEAFAAYEARRLPYTTRLVKQSLHLGRLGQWEQPLAVKVRTALMRMTPSRMAERTQMQVFNHDAYA